MMRWVNLLSLLNLPQSSYKKMGTFIGEHVPGGLYCEMRSCNFCVMEWNVYDEALYINGYLLKMSQMGKVVSGNVLPWTFGDIREKAWAALAGLLCA